jgi:hypothetical protein
MRLCRLLAHTLVAIRPKTRVRIHCVHSTKASKPMPKLLHRQLAHVLLRASLASWSRGTMIAGAAAHHPVVAGATAHLLVDVIDRDHLRVHVILVSVLDALLGPLPPRDRMLRILVVARRQRHVRPTALLLGLGLVMLRLGNRARRKQRHPRRRSSPMTLITRWVRSVHRRVSFP